MRPFDVIPPSPTPTPPPGAAFGGLGTPGMIALGLVLVIVLAAIVWLRSRGRVA